MKKDYHKLEKYTEANLANKSYLDYPDCMLLAAIQLGLTDIVVYCGITGEYSRKMDIHLEAKLNGKNVYFYLRQDYGSCSYCDWLEGAGEEKVINEYVKNLKLAFEI